jgi:hypothetical protein
VLFVYRETRVSINSGLDQLRSAFFKSLPERNRAVLSCALATHRLL